MSFKSYAIFAAVSLHNNQHRNYSGTNKLAEEKTSVSASVSQKSFKSSITTSPLSTNLVTNGLTPLPPVNLDHINAFQDRTESPVITYYNSDLSTFHQKNIRSNSEGIASFASDNGYNSGNSYSNNINGNANLLLGGAMLSLFTTILCVVCYCCHRNIKKRTEAAYRLHRQWLENDSNMEIYSVGQRYETTGLFLDESPDGLAVISALHHEPPPSYDAVVAALEQQLLVPHQHRAQRQPSSPPPGYRSSLDVNCAGTSLTVETPDISYNMATSESFEHFSNRPSQINIHKNGTIENRPLNIKDVLGGQSCCSLQRAEVELFWNTATADVAIGATHARITKTDATDREAIMNTCTRKSLPVFLGVKLSDNNNRREYLNQDFNCSGCSLCDKDRIDVVRTLSLSTARELDNSNTLSAATQVYNDELSFTGNNCDVITDDSNSTNSI